MATARPSQGEASQVVSLGSAYVQRGSLLLETLILMAVFGVLGVAVLGAVQTSYLAKGSFDIQSTAENIARNQLEYVFQQSYLPPAQEGVSYPALPPGSVPEGFSVEARALPQAGGSNSNISLVRIRVLKDGREVKVVETLRANRKP